MGDALPLVTLFGAVAAGVWMGGYRPAILVAILGYLACSYLFIEPRGRLGLDDPATWSGWWRTSSPAALIIGVRRGHAPRADRARASSASCCASRCAASATRSSRPTSRAASPIERRGRILDRLDAARGRGPAARRRVPDRQRGNPPAGREPGDEGAARRRRRRPGEPHGADSERRQRVRRSTTAPHRSGTSRARSPDAC